MSQDATTDRVRVLARILYGVEPHEGVFPPSVLDRAQQIITELEEAGYEIQQFGPGKGEEGGGV